MIVETDILLWTAWGFGVFMVILVIIPLIRENRRSFNALSHNFIKLVVVLALLQAGGFAIKYVLLNILGYSEPIVPKNLQTDMIILFGVLAVLLLFTLYAFNLRRHYGLPFIWYIFVIAFNIQMGTSQVSAPVISSAIIAGVLAVLFFYKASKNRSGLMFGIGAYIIVNLLFGIYDQYVAVGLIPTEVCDVLALVCGNIVLALATWEVYDRYLLYDRAREKSIKSTWISKLVTTGPTSAPVVSSDILQEIRRKVTCPSCHATTVWTIPPEVISSLNGSQKGLVLVHIPENTTCEHEYGLYLTKNFDVLGYKKSTTCD
jgi:hypothetical protein